MGMGRGEIDRRPRKTDPARPEPASCTRVGRFKGVTEQGTSEDYCESWDVALLQEIPVRLTGGEDKLDSCAGRGEAEMKLRLESIAALFSTCG